VQIWNVIAWKMFPKCTGNS